MRSSKLSDCSASHSPMTTLKLARVQIQMRLTDIMRWSIFAGLIFDIWILRRRCHNLRRLCAPGGTLVAVCGAKRGGKGGIAHRRSKPTKAAPACAARRHRGECAGVNPALHRVTKSSSLPSGKSFACLFFLPITFVAERACRQRLPVRRSAALSSEFPPAPCRRWVTLGQRRPPRGFRVCAADAPQ